MTENTISNAVAVRDNGPGAMVEQYREEYAALVPSGPTAETETTSGYAAG